MITKSADGQYGFDIAQYERVREAFTMEYNDIMGSRDVPRVTAFHKAAFESIGPDTDIGKAIAKVKTIGGPKKHIPFFMIYGYEAPRS